MYKSSLFLGNLLSRLGLVSENIVELSSGLGSGFLVLSVLGRLLSLSGDDLVLLLLASLAQQELLSSQGLGIGVQFDQNTEISQGVLLSLNLSLAGDLWSDLGLDFIGVDESGEVRVGQETSWKSVSILQAGLFGEGSVKRIQLLKGILGPDDKSSKMTSRGELQQIQTVDAGQFNTRDVSEGLDEGGLLVVDDQRSSLLGVSSVSQFSFASSDFLGVLDFLNVREGVEGLQQFDGSRGLLQIFDSVVGNNQRNLRNLLDSVTTSKDEGWDCTGCKCGDESVSSLVHVNLSVPFSPGLGGSEHSSATTHVSKSSLS